MRRGVERLGGDRLRAGDERLEPVRGDQAEASVRDAVVGAGRPAADRDHVARADQTAQPVADLVRGGVVVGAQREGDLTQMQAR